MNNNMKIIYDKFKIVLSGCNHISDAYELSIKFINAYPEYKQLITNMIYGKQYGNNLSIQSLSTIISEISKLEYSEDVTTLIDNKCDDKKLTEIQNRTFTRLNSMKPNKPYIPIYKAKWDDVICKKCPHCNHERKDKEDTNYVICGYNVRGYDDIGCRKDWCFKCGKKLCKNWIDHSLFIKLNCVHNKYCCTEYALENNLNYNKDMCQCINNKETDSNFNINTIIDTLITK
jgi:hypothetical protein